ncbi:cell division protein ZapA [Spirochaetia bacterium]|nr:cell division protein ZapA [Spirochaetia bacterium]
MDKNGLQINLLGTSFSIAADEDPVYLENLLERYAAIVENTKKLTGLSDPLKVAILTGFLLCDEIEKIREHEGRAAELLTLDLIARIDEVLPASEMGLPSGKAEE